MSTLHPTTCGGAVRVGEIYICGLACKPCPLYFEKPCEKLKAEQFMKTIKSIVNKEERNETAE